MGQFRPSRAPALRTASYPQTSAAVSHMHTFAGRAEFTVVHDRQRGLEMLEPSMTPSACRAHSRRSRPPTLLLPTTTKSNTLMFVPEYFHSPWVAFSL
jgi:hypothetical protein